MTNLEQLKKLRERTDASIASCKEALEKADGDMEKAAQYLQELGSKVAIKKADRAVGAGIVEAYIHSNKRIGVLLEVRSETDFVARNPDFKTLAHDIALHIAAANPENVGALMQQPYIRDEKRSVEDLLQEGISRFGENIQILNFVRYEI